MSEQTRNNADQSTHIPHVSIGFPVFNAEANLRQSLDSILAQTYTDFELLISDNCSTDGTAEICKEYVARDPRIRYERQPRNMGIQYNFNYTVQMARGELFKWTAADVIHDPTFLERCVTTLDEDEAIVCCHSRSDYIDFSGNRLYGVDPAGSAEAATSSVPHRRFADVLFKHGWGARVFAVIRREALLRTGLLEHHYGWHKVMFAGLALVGRYHLIDEILFLEMDHDTIEEGRDGSTAGQAESDLPATHDREGNSFHRFAFMRGYLQMAWWFSPNVYTALRCTGWVCLYPLQIGKWRRLTASKISRSAAYKLISKTHSQLFSGGRDKRQRKAVVDEHA
ncbi:MAG: glycosyltransferase family 2 protein [Phycisphaeraceae bacterium]